ncbi:glycosyltransferase family 2 protein [Massilia niabensis]|uniref:Glycosyltransferase family 2 protein n=1 Tax=Massilia niabensis TaxID=544910 RepID=A0ABW0L2Y5_9BURK
MDNNAAPMVDVTVVMACYNRSDLILRALESIRIQRIWPQQVIVVDDASKDDSVIKVRDWAAKTGFPVVVEALERNGGAAPARNRGIELAETTYIAFVDSDDEQMGDALGKLAAALDSNPSAVLSFGEGTKITPTERIPDAMFCSKVDMVNECELLDQGSPRYRLRDAKSTMLKASLIPTSGSFFRRADALAVGGMPAQFRTGEDWLFWLKLSERGDFIYVPENLACVHRHADNLTHPGSAAQTSQHKLAGFLALLDGSAGIQINARQRARLKDFADARAKLLRYQASRLGLGPYLHSLRNLPPSRRKSFLSHLIEDPKSMLRAVSCSVRPAPPPQTR